ncbi:MAG: IreB family regulatory phosphoprotein [Bacilli bacterium]|nr:IreB family regulatory phosphoprotein [Bacilli bacterium]
MSRSDYMDNTSLFKVSDIENALVSKTLIEVYRSLESRGYNPTSQIIGYLITGDPGFITSYENARSKMTNLDREKVLEIVLKDYMKNNL